MTDTTSNPQQEVAPPLKHQYTAGELADALRAACTDHHPTFAALCTEAAHRILVLHGANAGLVTEADRLRHHLRIANTRVDEMRDSVVTINGRMDDMRRQVDMLTPPRAPVQLHQDYRLNRLHPTLLARIKEAMGEATTCWSDFASAGTFQGERLNNLTTNLALALADELELAKMRRKDDDQVDWRRRALEAERRADDMALGIMSAQADRLENDITTHQATAPARPIRTALKTLFGIKP